jgi:S1-C subfamily serine protease
VSQERSRLALRRAAPIVGAGAVGAALALGVAAVAGGMDGSTTTVRELVSAPPPGERETSAFAQADHPLTIHQIYLRSAPGVVQVTATSTQVALGSGFVIDKAGHIVTNYHVVQGANSVEISFSDNERRPAHVIGRDASTDIAVLQVDGLPARALAPLELGDSDHVRVGDAVVAIGNPLGEDRSITSGIVSALQREIAAPNGAPIGHAIQTDAALNPGNSGGPLLNTLGEVIGVSSQIQTAGVGFAIPINTVKDVAAQLISKGVVEHAFLGVETQGITRTVARLFRLPTTRGLLVGTVCADSSAAHAGLRGATQQVTLAGDTWPLGGDIIVKLDGAPVFSVAQLRSAIADSKPGQTVRLAILRGVKSLTLNIKLGRQPLSQSC